MSARKRTSERILGAFGAALGAAGAALRGETYKPSGLSEPEDWLRELFAPATASGVQVSEGSAMRLAAHYACVSLVSRTMGSFPIHVYERLGDGKKRKATEHPVDRLLHTQPNPEMTPFTFQEVLQANLSNAGRAYAEIVWGTDGYPKELWPLQWNRVTPRRRADGVLEYLVDGDVLPNWKILHIPGLGFDGLNSYSPVGLFRQTIGLGLALEEFGARFFGQGTNLGGFIEHPKEMSETAYTRLKASVEEKYQGLQKSHGLIILEDGAKYSKIGMPNDDAQFIETNKLNRSTIAMIHGVQPHLIGDLEHATFSNIEHQGIEAVMYLFRPWAVRWEQTLSRKLLTPREQGRFYVKFNLDSLLRGDIKSRYEAYAIGRQWGWLSADDIREKEDEDPLPDDKGKVYLQPLNMVPATGTVATRVELPTMTGLARRKRLYDREMAAFELALATRRNLEATSQRIWQELSDIVREEVGPVSGEGTAFISGYLETLRQRIDGTASGNAPSELHRMCNAFLRELYRLAGVRKLALAPGRLFRDLLASRTVSVDAAFFEKGEVLRSGNLSVTIDYRVWNPPIFPGDDSEIIPILED